MSFKIREVIHMNKLTLTVLGLSLLGTLASAEEMKPAAPAKTEAAMPAKAAAPAKAKPAKAAMKKSKKAAAPMQEAKAVYKCEHCNVTSDKPGKCSMCGMDLKKI